MRILIRATILVALTFAAAAPAASADVSAIPFTRCLGFGPGSQCDVMTMSANGTGVVNVTNTPDLTEGFPV